MDDLTDEYRRMLAEAREALARERARRTGDLAAEFAQLLFDADDQIAAARVAQRRARTTSTPQEHIEVDEGLGDEDFTTEAAIHQFDQDKTPKTG